MNTWARLRLQIALEYQQLVARLYGVFTSKRAPITKYRARKIRVQLEMNAVLIKQFQDAKRKQKKSYHWGEIGWQVENAAAECEIILRSSDSEDVAHYFARVLPAISALANHYRLSQLDESGYALATVREIERALLQNSDKIQN